MDSAMPHSSITSKGRSPSRKALRQQVRVWPRGQAACVFALVGDHIELRPWKPEQPLPESGFRIAEGPAGSLPADFGPRGSLLRP